MTMIQPDLPPPCRIERTLAVIDTLHQCDPLSASSRRTHFERWAELWSRRCLIAAGIVQAVPWLVRLVWWLNDGVVLSSLSKWVLIGFVALSLLLTLASFLLPIVAAGWVLLRWKTISRDNLKAEIRHEQAFAERLQAHDEDDLKDARIWLELKIKRLEGRIALFFGDKTATLGLLATAYLFLKEFGGFALLSGTLSVGLSTENVGDQLLVAAAALVFGISIGAVLLKQIAVRYRYQVEIIDLALR